MKNDLEKWKKTNSTYIVEDRWLKLRSDSYVTPDGHEIDSYFILEFPDWANCFVIDENLDVIMVNHYRPGADSYIPELVSGELEKSDTSPEVGMQRELEEEIGYVGGKIYRTGVSYPNPGRQDNKVYSFVAIGGSCSQAQRLEAGENLQIIKMPLSDLLAKINNVDSGIIYQSMHLASIFLALNFIKSSNLPELQELGEEYLI